MLGAVPHTPIRLHGVVLSKHRDTLTFTTDSAGLITRETFLSSLPRVILVSITKSDSYQHYPRVILVSVTQEIHHIYEPSFYEVYTTLHHELLMTGGLWDKNHTGTYSSSQRQESRHPVKFTSLGLTCAVARSLTVQN